MFFSQPAMFNALTTPSFCGSETYFSVQNTEKSFSSDEDSIILCPEEDVTEGSLSEDCETEIGVKFECIDMSA